MVFTIIVFVQFVLLALIIGNFFNITNNRLSFLEKHYMRTLQVAEFRRKLLHKTIFLDKLNDSKTMFYTNYYFSKLPPTEIMIFDQKKLIMESYFSQKEIELLNSKYN